MLIGGADDRFGGRKAFSLESNMISSLRMAGAAALVGTVSFLFSASSLQAANLWDGGGSTNFWGDAQNWDNNLVPVFPVPLTFAGSVQTNPSNNLTGAILKGINFSSGAASFTVSGNAVTLGTAPAGVGTTGGVSGGISDSGGIANNSSNPQTVSLPLILASGKHYFTTINAPGVNLGGLTLSGAITRQPHSTAGFIIGGNINTTLVNDSTGIIGGWATTAVPVGTSPSSASGTSWASVDGTGKIVPFTAFSHTFDNTSGFPAGVTAASNVNYQGGTVAGGVTVPAGTAMNTMLFSDPDNNVSTMTLSGSLTFNNGGGIFRSENALPGSSPLTARHVITGGSITAGTSGPADLYIRTRSLPADANTPAGPPEGFDIDSPIIDNPGGGAVTLIKSGYGVMRLHGNSNYSGGTYVNEGQLRPENNANALGIGPVYVAADAQVLLGGANVTFTHDFFISGLGPNEGAFRGGALRMINSGMTVDGTITLVGDARIGGRGTGAGSTVKAPISGNFALEFNNVGTTAGTLIVTNVLNNWTGDTTISPGTLKLGNSGVIPDGPGFGNVIMGTALAGDQNTVFDLNGQTETINGLTTTGILTKESITSSSGTATLIVGNNNANGNVGAPILNGAGTLALTKIGNGTLTLSSATASTYSGGTVVKGGKLIVNTTVLSSGAVNLQTSATGAGTLYGVTSVGDVTLDAATGANKAVINPGATGPGSAGTINMTSLSVGAGSNLQFDAFSSVPTTGFDQIHVSGALTFGGATTITPTFVVSGSPITVIQADGGITGPIPTLGTDSDSRLTYSLSSTANAIQVTASGSVASLLWTGSGDTTTWDLHSTQNFKNTGTNLADKFFSGDNVTFDGTASPNFTVNLIGSLAPTSVTVNNATGSYVFSGSGFISGASTLTKSGGGTLTLATNNVFTGGTTLNAGTLNVNHNGALGLPDASITGLTINGGTLDNTSGAAVTEVGNPTQLWTTNILFTGTNDLNLGTGAVTQTNLPNTTNRTVTVNGSTLTIGGAIAEGNGGNNGITKLGSGTLALTGSNSFTGPVTITQGTVKIGNSSALGSNTVPGTVVASGAALDVGGFDAANASGVSGPIKISGTGVGGHGALTNSSALAQNNALQGIVTLAADASVGGTSRFDIRNGSLVLAGHTLTKVDSNQFVLSGATVDAGNIVVNQGIFGIDAGTNIDTAGGTITVNASGNLQFSTNSGTVTRPITVVGAGTISDATAAAGSATVGSNITLQGNATFASTNASTLTLSNQAPNTGVISESGGSRSITKTGPGTLVLQNTSDTYTGGTNFNGGVINIAAVHSLGTGPLSFNGGTLQYASGLTDDVSVLPITLLAGGGTIDSNSNAITLAHNIGGVGGLAVRGNNSITLTGTNTYAGTTAIQQNVTLVVGSPGALPVNTPLTIGDSTNNGGTLDLNGRNVSVSSLTRTGAGAAVVGSGSTTASSTLTFNGSGTASTFPGFIQDITPSGGSGQTTSLTVNSGSLTLTGSNSYSGTTRVNGGTLALGSGGSLNSVSPLELGGGKFGTGGQSPTFKTLNVTAASTLDFGNGSSVLTFTNGSAAPTWGGLLTISNWNGNSPDPKLGGGQDEFVISGLSATQLQTRIKFDGFPLGAQVAVNNPGEVVPSGLAYVPGDFDLDRSVTKADVPAMLSALTDLNNYKTVRNLTNADLLVIGDLDHSGSVTNADIQGVLDLAAVGSGSVAAVPEPASAGLVVIGGLAIWAARRRRNR